MVFTDLADSTALKTERGDVAAGELMARHRDHVTRLAGDCGGRIIDWAGDGCFLTFDTSSAGVLFGLKLQETHHWESALPKVRVGVHMGEVTEKPFDGGVRVEGLIVDLTARISGLAAPGQVLISGAVQQKRSPTSHGRPPISRSNSARGSGGGRMRWASRFVGKPTACIR